MPGSAPCSATRRAIASAQWRRTTTGAVVQQLQAGLDDLGLSALSTACGCAAGGTSRASEVEQRLALHFSAAVTADGVAELELLDDPPPGSPAGALGLRDLLELGTELLDLLASGRQADQRAFAADAPAPDAPPDTVRPDAAVDPAELKGRADAAVEALRTAVARLAAAGPAATSDQLISRLLEVAAVGARTAVPDAADPVALANQATAVVEAGHRVVAALDAAEAAFDRTAVDPPVEPPAEVAHDLERLRQIFGASFPAVATFSVADNAQLTQSAADPALFGDDPLAPATWLEQHAQVRPAAGRLVGALTAVEMLGGGTGLDQLTVAQLPHTPGERWIGLPAPNPTTRSAATVSMVMHSADPVSFSAPMAGLVLDQWADVVPNDHETTGVSFHFDAPGARAPQAILVAVPGDRKASSWTVDALAGTVRDAVALARIRALDTDDLDAVGRFLPAIYLPFNIESETPSINLASIINLAIKTDNIAFLGQG